MMGGNQGNEPGGHHSRPGKRYKAVFIGYWAGLVRMEKNKQGAHIKLSIHLHISSINVNNNH